VSRRINPDDQVVAFFETAPLEQCATVLTIARGILARRQPKAKPAKPGRKGASLIVVDVESMVDDVDALTRPRS
jgi:hypothetical protein